MNRSRDEGFCCALQGTARWASIGAANAVQRGMSLRTIAVFQYQAAYYAEQARTLLLRLVGAPPADPRDPDYTRSGIFINHNCWKCQDGKKPCAKGNPNQCEYPRARND